LANMQHKQHPALESLLAWFAERGASDDIRGAAQRAHTILRAWIYSRPDEPMSAPSAKPSRQTDLLLGE